MKKTKIISQHLLRQMDLLGPEDLGRVEAVHMFGVGGIGGPTALLLAKMGIRKIYLYDKDTVEPHNIGSQLFGHEDIDQPKTKCVKRHIEALLPVGACEIICVDGNLVHKKHPIMDMDSILSKDKINLFIFSVDSNDIRRILYKIFDKIIDKKKSVYIIDPRMGGLGFSIDANDIIEGCTNYEDFTPEDKDIPDEMCTARAISFNTFCCAGMIAAVARRAIQGKTLPKLHMCMNNFILEDENNIITPSP